MAYMSQIRNLKLFRNIYKNTTIGRYNPIKLHIRSICFDIDKTNTVYQKNINKFSNNNTCLSYNECPFCNGYKYIKCIECSGVGKILYYDKEYMCDDCCGRGCTICDFCGGSGLSHLSF